MFWVFHTILFSWRPDLSGPIAWIRERLSDMQDNIRKKGGRTTIIASRNVSYEQLETEVQRYAQIM